MESKVNPVVVVCTHRQVSLKQNISDRTLLGIVTLKGDGVEEVELGPKEAQSIACWLAKRYGFGIETTSRVVKVTEYTAVPVETPVTEADTR